MILTPKFSLLSLAAPDCLAKSDGFVVPTVRPMAVSWKGSTGTFCVLWWKEKWECCLESNSLVITGWQEVLRSDESYFVGRGHLSEIQAAVSHSKQNWSELLEMQMLAMKFKPNGGEEMTETFFQSRTKIY